MLTQLKNPLCHPPTFSKMLSTSCLFNLIDTLIHLACLDYIYYNYISSSIQKQDNWFDVSFLKTKPDFKKLTSWPDDLQFKSNAIQQALKKVLSSPKKNLKICLILMQVMLGFSIWEKIISITALIELTEKNLKINSLTLTKLSLKAL